MGHGAFKAPTESFLSACRITPRGIPNGMMAGHERLHRRHRGPRRRRAAGGSRSVDPGIAPLLGASRYRGVERVGRRLGVGARMTDFRWTEEGSARSARWRSESGHAPPARGIAAGDALTAASACRIAGEDQGIVWRGDFQNARKL